MLDPEPLDVVVVVGSDSLVLWCSAPVLASWLEPVLLSWPAPVAVSFVWPDVVSGALVDGGASGMPQSERAAVELPSPCEEDEPEEDEEPPDDEDVVVVVACICCAWLDT